MLKSELAKQHTLIDSDDSASLSRFSNKHLQIPENSESTTHCIKVYRDQLETLQKDNFSLKLQLYYFQRAFESAGIHQLFLHYVLFDSLSFYIYIRELYRFL